MNKFICFLALLSLLIACNLSRTPANAQFTATPTSPVFCFPATPVQPGESWYCVNGTAIVGTPTPIPTIPTTPPTPAPTTTPVPYPLPLRPDEDGFPMPLLIPSAPEFCMDAIIEFDYVDTAVGSTVDLIHPSVCQITLRTADEKTLTFVSNNTTGDYTVIGFGTRVGFVSRNSDESPRITNVYIYFTDLDQDDYLPIIMREHSLKP